MRQSERTANAALSTRRAPLMPVLPPHAQRLMDVATDAYISGDFGVTKQDLSDFHIMLDKIARALPR